MKAIIQAGLGLIFTIPLFSNAFAENTFDPFANLPPPPAAMPGGINFQKMQKAQEAREQKKKEKQAERKAISKKITQEELTEAKGEVNPNFFDDPYALAEMRTKERMKPIYAQWEAEDKAETAPADEKNKAAFQKWQKTGDYRDFAKQQREVMKQMGIEMPTPGQ